MKDKREKVDPRAALYNRLALTGGQYTPEELEDWHDRQDEKEGIIAGEDDELGAVDINPMNYLASAATGAFGGILSKADQDLEDVQKAIRKKKKKKKKRVETEPEVEEAPPASPPAVRLATRAMRLVPWHVRYKNYLYGAAGVGAALVLPRLFRR